MLIFGVICLSLDRSALRYLLILHILQHRKPADGMLVGSSSRSVIGDGPASPKYSDRLSPAINHYMSEAARQEVRVRHMCSKLTSSFELHKFSLLHMHSLHLSPFFCDRTISEIYTSSGNSR